MKWISKVFQHSWEEQAPKIIFRLFTHALSLLKINLNLFGYSDHQNNQVCGKLLLILTS